MAGTKKDAQAFVERWRGIGNEKSDTQRFWIDFYQSVLGCDDATSRLQFENRVMTDADSTHPGFIDVLVPSASLLIEQKSLGVDLDEAERRQGRLVTPAQQGAAYAAGLPLDQQPRYVMACNFGTIRVHDRNIDAWAKGRPKFEISLEDVPENLGALQFMVGAGEAPEVVSRKVSVEAGRIMGAIHDGIAALYRDPDSEQSHHALAVLCTRLMFLMFCEDVELVKAGLFRQFVEETPARWLAPELERLFLWLDTPPEERDRQESPGPTIERFPYMDGGLFREKIQIPPLNDEIRQLILVDGCQEFDWSEVDPTVFGAIFEGALSHDKRRSGGMHYTSPENIHKVIDPLFLDDLRAGLEEAMAKPVVGGARTKALNALHDRVASVSVLDPACGSGNFLTESYLSLRRLEDRIISEQMMAQGSVGGTGLDSQAQTAIAFAEFEDDNRVRVTLESFHGIEVNDFAVAVANAALWIAEKQADINTDRAGIKLSYDPLPLKDYGCVVRGNALTMDWDEVCEAAPGLYVAGNPPFIGQYLMDEGQKEDMRGVWGDDYEGYLDYVTGWYRKAADFLEAVPNASFAFVSTNSITQGKPVPALFGPLFRDGWHILFAHQTFVWDSVSDDQAHVHVVIVGLTNAKRFTRTLFSYPRHSKGADGSVSHPDNINPYLIQGGDAFVKSRSKPLSPYTAPAVYGYKPIDHGYLFLKGDALAEARKDPIASKYIRRFYGATELINDIERWCLWLEDATPKEIRTSPLLRERVSACRAWRTEQGERPVDPKPNGDAYKHRDTPHLMRPIKNPPEGPVLAVPCHFSGGRDSFTVKWVDDGSVIGNACFMIDDPSGLAFAILESSMFMAWQRAIGGRLKSDPRFASTLVWNTFPMPQLDEESRAAVIEAGQGVVAAQDAHPDMSLADLYDPEFMYQLPDLVAAHERLDATVDEAFGGPFDTDEERLSVLFDLYGEMSK